MPPKKTTGNGKNQANSKKGSNPPVLRGRRARSRQEIPPEVPIAPIRPKSPNTGFTSYVGPPVTRRRIECEGFTPRREPRSTMFRPQDDAKRGIKDKYYPNFPEDICWVHECHDYYPHTHVGSECDVGLVDPEDCRRNYMRMVDEDEGTMRRRSLSRGGVGSKPLHSELVGVRSLTDQLTSLAVPEERTSRTLKKSSSQEWSKMKRALPSLPRPDGVPRRRPILKTSAPNSPAPVSDLARRISQLEEPEKATFSKRQRTETSESQTTQKTYESGLTQGFEEQFRSTQKTNKSSRTWTTTLDTLPWRRKPITGLATKAAKVKAPTATALPKSALKNSTPIIKASAATAPTATASRSPVVTSTESTTKKPTRKKVAKEMEDFIDESSEEEDECAIESSEEEYAPPSPRRRRLARRSAIQPSDYGEEDEKPPYRGRSRK